MAQNFIEQFKSARRVSTSLIGVTTPDPAATMQTILTAYTNVAEVPAILCWDIVRGVVALNDQGQEAFDSLFTHPEKRAAEIDAKEKNQSTAEVLSQLTIHPVDILIRAHRLPRRSILFLLNPQRYIDQPAYIQGLWNLRDSFKANRRTAVLLGPSLELPEEISQDVLILDEPFPDRAQLEEIVLRAHADAKLGIPKPEVVSKAVDALSGLGPYSAEQVTFLSIDPKTGINIERVWDRKRQQIEQTHGLSVWRGGETFNQISGLANLKCYVKKLLRGKKEISLIFFLDEVEKMFAGIQGDLSGTSQEMFGNFLSWMQDHNVVGLLLLGHPGTGKSLVAKAAGSELGGPVIVGDISGMKGSLIGESGQNMRSALKVVDATAGGKTILVIATCNADTILPPELKRRFKSGTFFLDLMDEKERKGAWDYYIAKYKLTDTKLPSCEGWTGAEIEQCCELAWSLEMSLIEAAEFVVPVAESAKEQITALRQLAAGRFISASYPGKYQIPVKKVIGQRREVD
jgi:hypothetical protein